VQQVARAWDNVRKRTKQKSKSGLLAAYLANFSVVSIEGTAEQPVVVIQTEKPNHLKYVKDEQRYKDLEWALQMEFNLPACQVRLIFADQTSALAEPTVYSTGASAVLDAQPSAYREPASRSSTSTPRDEQPSSLDPIVERRDTSGQRTSPGETPSPQTYDSSHPYEESPAGGLARKNVIRENRQSATNETLEQKASRDPVVQEVIRTFTAKIVDIHPK